jgi:hypothetical protein
VQEARSEDMELSDKVASVVVVGLWNSRYLSDSLLSLCQGRASLELAGGFRRRG